MVVCCRAGVEGDLPLDLGRSLLLPLLLLLLPLRCCCLLLPTFGEKRIAT